MDVEVSLDGKLGVITALKYPDQPTIHFYDTPPNATQQVPASQLTKPALEKKKSVKIIAGNQQYGQIGHLIAIDGMEGVIKLRGNVTEMKVVPVANLAKCGRDV